MVLGCGGLSAAELKRQASGIESVAAEGELLAEQVAEERGKDTFVRVHSDDLSGQMQHTEEKLHETEQEGEVPDELSDQVKETIELAGDADDALNELHLNPSDPAQARATRTKLEEVSTRAGNLVDTL